MNNRNQRQDPFRINTVSIASTPAGSYLSRRVKRRRQHVSTMQKLAALLLAFGLVLLSARAFAASDLSAGNDAVNSAVAVLQAPIGKDGDGGLRLTWIEMDHETGEIRFIINGETAAILNKNGLIVDGNVNGHAFLHGPSTAASEPDSDQADNQDEGGAP